MSNDLVRGTPRISVVVPTYGRPERVQCLMQRLDAQTLPTADFEVIVVDDGTPIPIAIEPGSTRCDVRVLRQANAGPGAARNRGVDAARAPLVIFLNDDAVPADDLLAVHLATHANAPDKVAVLGTFTFTANALKEPFTQILARSDLLFSFSLLEHGKLLPWTTFWTCNISLPKAALLEVGGFDTENFHEAIVEDVEIGYRLQKLGWRVMFRSDARCEHEHALTAADYFRRGVRLGVNLARMWKKHQDPRILWCSSNAQLGRSYLHSLQRRVEAYHESTGKFIELMKRRSEEFQGRELPDESRRPLEHLTRQLSFVPYARGVLMELTGTDPVVAMERGPSMDSSVSILVCSYDALAKTKNCLESLRRTLDPTRPVQIVFVDNGSRDGSAEWLAAQPDIVLIQNRENAGAPRARNQALARATGEYVVFLDNDIVLTPEWLERLIYHAELDGRTGCVGACADRASHGQEVAYSGSTEPATLDAFARSHAAANHRRNTYAPLLASFCILAKRAVIDAIGGFDERFSPWGFEDDDFTLRAFLAGWSNRIANDVFVHHDTYAGVKLARHTELLERNWKHFASKWELGDVRYGDMSPVRDVMRRTHARERLYIALPAEPPAALPRSIDVRTNPARKATVNS